MGWPGIHIGLDQNQIYKEGPDRGHRRFETGTSVDKRTVSQGSPRWVLSSQREDPLLAYPRRATASVSSLCVEMFNKDLDCLRMFPCLAWGRRPLSRVDEFVCAPRNNPCYNDAKLKGSGVC